MKSICLKATSARHLSELLKETILAQKGYWLGSAYCFRKISFDIRTFESQIASFSFEDLKQTYLDLVIAPYLVLTNPSNNVGYTADTKFYYRVHDTGSLAGGSTPEKARKAALKGKQINQLIYQILRANHAPTAHLRRRTLILEYYDYLAALYSGEFATAGRLYARLARRLWNLRQLVKETQRFLAVRFFGAARFLSLKDRM